MIQRNLTLNPSLVLDAAGWGSDATGTKGRAAGTIAPWCYRATQGATGTLNAYYVPILDWLGTAATLSIGIGVRVSAAGRARLTVTFRNSSNAVVGTQAVGPLVDNGAGQVLRLTLAGIAVPAGATRAVVIVGASTAAGTVLPVGTTLEVAALMATAGDSVVDYADGDSVGWVWEGTRGASASRGPLDYRPEAELRYLATDAGAGAHVAWLDQLEGFELLAESATTVHRSTLSTLEPVSVSHRPAGTDTGTLVARFHAETGAGGPATRAADLYRVLKSGVPLALVWQYAPWDMPSGPLSAIVPVGRLALARVPGPAARWTVTAEVSTFAAGEVAP